MLRTSLLLFASIGAIATTADKLTMSEAGTYIVTASLDSTPVRLVVDSDVSGIWVRCSVFQSASCETADPSTIAGADTEYIGRADVSPAFDPQDFIEDKDEIVYTAKPFARIKVGGVTFQDMNVSIAYNPLGYLPTGADGIFGISHRKLFAPPRTSSPLPTIRASISLDLEDQTLVMNQSVSDFVKASPRDVAVDLKPFRPWETMVMCVRPMMNTTTSEEPCLPLQASNYSYFDQEYVVDPAAATIVLPLTSLEFFAKQYLQGCTSVKPTGMRRHVLYYECPNELARRLPALAFEINSWRFTLQPVDYTDTFSRGNEVTKVLIGSYEYGVPFQQLGAPFVRKFPSYYNTIGDGMLVLLCNNGSSCSAVDANATNLKPVYEKMGETDTPPRSDSKGSEWDTPTTTPKTPGTTEPNSAPSAAHAMWWTALLLLTISFVGVAY